MVRFLGVLEVAGVLGPTGFGCLGRAGLQGVQLSSV